MELYQLSAIAEILGAVATIAGLLFLSIQVRDNTKVTRTSTLASMLEDARDRTAGQLCSNPEVSDIVARGCSSIDMLDDKEQLRFTFFIMETILHMQNVMQLNEAKLLDKNDYLAWLGWTGAILRTPGARVIWPQVSAVITPNISSVLKTHLKETQDFPMLLDIMPVFDRRESVGVA